MMPSWQLLITLLVAWLLSAILMTALWRRQRRGRNAAAVVDVAWSFCTGLVAVAGAAVVDGDPGRRLLVAGLALAWAVRLGVHLVQRLRREGEDGRYEMMKERWGGEDERASDRKMLGFYQLQAAWTVGFALPLIAAAAGDKPLGQWHDFAAVAIWLIGWAGETLADRQLAAFKAEADQGGEKTKVCRRGFWRYTRHPNYFFEWLQWWCWPLLALGSSTVWVALAGPIVMYLFLTRVTGIPPTEQQALRSRGDAYRQYQQETNAFFPGPPSTTTDT